ncbi:Hypothetical predicted protein [Octopus vulgaris]|uniref:Secreted protein n=1 Tax=Octopus vulgaris TaxID=6645 RepID=A0AA36BUN5_OCTVU|nr:Hypothetical predicted protein [Octopus vulgaris]
MRRHLAQLCTPLLEYHLRLALCCSGDGSGHHVPPRPLDRQCCNRSRSQLAAQSSQLKDFTSVIGQFTNPMLLNFSRGFGSGPPCDVFLRLTATRIHTQRNRVYTHTPTESQTRTHINRPSS